MHLREILGVVDDLRPAADTVQGIREGRGCTPVQPYTTTARTLRGPHRGCVTESSWSLGASPRARSLSDWNGEVLWLLNHDAGEALLKPVEPVGRRQLQGEAGEADH
jgi:hypothetical protein